LAVGVSSIPLGRMVSSTGAGGTGGAVAPGMAKVRMTGWLRLPLWSRVLTMTTYRPWALTPRNTHRQLTLFALVAL